MKIKYLFILPVALVLLLNACKKDDDTNTDDNNQSGCTTCITTSEALAAYDSSSAGVYKAVLAGSSGYITFYVMNGNNEIKANLLFDGQAATLTTTQLSGWQPGQAIDSAEFSGNLNNQTVKAYLSVDADGQNPKINVVYPGHNISTAIRKEFSSRIVHIYEGAYTGTDSGAMNMVIDGRYFILINKYGFMWNANKPSDGIFGPQLTYDGQGGKWKVRGHFYSDEAKFTGAWYGTGSDSGSFALYRTH
jgi:hypothetical protein